MYLSDIEIAQSVTPQPIQQIADKLHVDNSLIEPFGKYKAKLNLTSYDPKGNLVLVTAINPTSAGEGKTTISIGLADGLSLLGKSTCLALREPSLGPVFGVKGGATGGGKAQVIPMEDINLHFTGDLHAITSANNLLSALLDNSLQQGNPLNINPKKIVWNRCVDLNDRALRSVTVGQGAVADGVMRQDSFNITAASEIMAIFCLSNSLAELKQKLSKITLAYTYDNLPITAGDLHAQDALTILLKDALKPNLVQTLEHTPTLIHGGPFANIAHGCNSIIATKTALTYADYCVTEAGFGADLGAEKFLDVKCRLANIVPKCVVIVATTKALKLHGGSPSSELKQENLITLNKGLANLSKHVENITRQFKLPSVVAINRFVTDTAQEIDLIKQYCLGLGVEAVTVTAWEEGGKGAIELAQKVVDIIENTTIQQINYTYSLEQKIEQKIENIAKLIYGASAVEYSAKAKKDIQTITANGLANLPIIIAKTQYSLTDDAKKLGRPTNFTLTVREAQLRSGAGFIVAVCGDVMLMPGLPKIPSANNMTISDEGVIRGLF